METTEWEDLKFIFALLMLPIILVSYLLIELVNFMFEPLLVRFIFYLFIFGVVVVVIVETDILKNASKKLDAYLS